MWGTGGEAAGRSHAEGKANPTTLTREVDKCESLGGYFTHQVASKLLCTKIQAQILHL